MMPFHPFYGSSNFRRYYNPYNSYFVHDNLEYKIKNQKDINNTHNNNLYNINKKDSNKNDVFIRNVTDSNADEEIFDFFGLKLSFDDLLILFILFFLYKEDTKDPYIFIALILLLLN